jgi:hypothetical protein
MNGDGVYSGSTEAGRRESLLQRSLPAVRVAGPRESGVEALRCGPRRAPAIGKNVAR